MSLSISGSRSLGSARWTILTGMALLLQAGVAAAQTADDSLGVARAFERYHEFVLRMEHDSVASLFAPDGELASTGRPAIVGPEAVRTFLQSFSAFKVIADTMRAATLEFAGDTAFQIGTYWQLVKIPAGDTVVAQGGFELTWIRGAAGSWLIRRMGTRPIKAPPRGH